MDILSKHLPHLNLPTATALRLLSNMGATSRYVLDSILAVGKVGADPTVDSSAGRLWRLSTGAIRSRARTVSCLTVYREPLKDTVALRPLNTAKDLLHKVFILIHLPLFLQGQVVLI